jgi:hypothetical protein
MNRALSENVAGCPAAAASLGQMAAAINWMLCLTVSVGALLAPALWNRFPVVFFDTGGYMSRVMEMDLVPGRSFFYGLFLWAASLGWWSFWGPVLVQSLFALWLIYLMLRCHDLPSGPLPTTLFSLGLVASTGISWYTSQLMPDVLVPLVAIALWLLGFRWQRLARAERWGLAGVALLGLLSHMSCMALAIGLSIVTLVARGVVAKRGWKLPVTCWPPVAVVASSLVLMPMVHLALVGEACYTPGGSAFVFGSLVQEGIAQRWLKEHCPVPGIKLCTRQERLPTTADDFLWGGTSPFLDLGGWDGAEPELSRLVRECVKAYPGQVAWAAIRATARQLVKVATGDGLDEIHNHTRWVFSNRSPRIAREFIDANQQQGLVTQPLFDTLNLVHIPIAHLSLMGLFLAIGWGLRAKRYDLMGLASFTLLALLGNAFICGALSNPHDRYQSRVVWLATMVVAMTAVSWWQLRSEKQPCPDTPQPE